MITSIVRSVTGVQHGHKTRILSSFFVLCFRQDYDRSVWSVKTAAVQAVRLVRVRFMGGYNAPDTVVRDSRLLCDYCCILFSKYRLLTGDKQVSSPPCIKRLRDCTAKLQSYNVHLAVYSSTEFALKWAETTCILLSDRASLIQLGPRSQSLA